MQDIRERVDEVQPFKDMYTILMLEENPVAEYTPRISTQGSYARSPKLTPLQNNNQRPNICRPISPQLVSRISHAVEKLLHR